MSDAETATECSIPDGQGREGFAPGELVAGKYRVVRELGRGMYGVVLEALDEFLARGVAIKTFRDQARAADVRSTQRLRFEREARVVAKLNDPNIVPVFDAGLHRGSLFIAFELIAGESLRSLLQAQPVIPLESALGLADQLLRGLDYAHQRGVIHRDIKPENVLLRKDGVLKIADFGIAKAMDSTAESLTLDNTVIGTPHYMAPEQVRGQDLTPAVDVYAAAVVLYEMLTGRKPFEASSFHALMYAILSEPPPPFDEKVELPPHVRDAILRGLSKEPERRFTALEFLAALRGSEAAAVPAIGEVTPVPRRAPILGLDAAPWKPVFRQPPHVSGTLSARSAPELLLWLRRRREAGTFTVLTSAFALGLEFRDGAPVGAAGGPAGTELGHVMRRLGFLNDAKHRALLEEHAEASAREPRPIGHTALKLGFLKAEDLLRALESQIDARVDMAVGLEQGRYELRRGVHSSAWDELAPRPVEILIRQGLEARPSRQRELCDGFVRRDRERMVRRADGIEQVMASFRFSPRVQRLARLLDGERSLSQVIDANVLPSSEATLALYLLWGAGGLTLHDAPVEGPTQPPRASAPAPPAVAVLPRAAQKEEGPKEPRVTEAPVAPPESVKPQAPTHTIEDEVRDRIQAAQMAVQRGEIGRAVHLLQRAREADPQNARVLSALGWATFRKDSGHPSARQEAKLLLEAALALDPRNAETLVHLARVLRHEHDLDKAVQYLDRAAEVDPTSVDVRLEREALRRERRTQTGGWHRAPGQ